MAEDVLETDEEVAEKTKGPIEYLGNQAGNILANIILEVK